MNERPTPETDAFLKEFYPEHPEAAWVRTQLGVTFEGPLEQILKRLERERDEALEELNDIRVNLGDDAKGLTLLHGICALQNERDDLYYKLEDTKQSLEVVLEELNQYKTSQISSSLSD